MTEHRFCCAEAHIQRKKKIEKNGIGDPISVIRDRQRNDCRCPGTAAVAEYEECVRMKKEKRTAHEAVRAAVLRLQQERDLPDEELGLLIESTEAGPVLAEAADRVRREVYGTDVYIRGLIEFTNYCKNNCYYCGIRASDTKTVRYRLTEEQIMLCCEEGYRLGFRTFVLQGGEDPFFDDERLCEIISEIKSRYPDCAVTLSVGEKTKESYQAYFDAGADRYLLRHETADECHYGKLHPANMSLSERKRCLYDLKEIGYQVGSGFMVGTPYQSTETLIRDLRFLQELRPDMIGIGPYIEHMDTPMGVRYKAELEAAAEVPEKSGETSDGDGESYGALTPEERMHKTLRLVSILRLMFPYALLPSTTALGTIHPEGREMGLKAGANVVMPNLSPVETREFYDLYENKICTGEEAAQGRDLLEQRVLNAGYRVVTAVGHVKKEKKQNEK